MLSYVHADLSFLYVLLNTTPSEVRGEAELGPDNAEDGAINGDSEPATIGRGTGFSRSSSWLRSTVLSTHLALVKAPLSSWAAETREEMGIHRRRNSD
jgi:hypothetical protein